MEAVDVALAFEYPYARPDGDFVFHPGRRDCVEAVTPGAHLLAGRTAVIAAGSNASPAQLARKFPDQGAVIPVVRAAMRDHDVVYAAAFAPYGAVPATLYGQPGTTVQVHVTFLTDAQLEAMHQSERVAERIYAFEPVPRGLLELEVDWDAPVYYYRATSGPLLAQGWPIALSAIPAQRRLLPDADEPDLLGRIARQSGLEIRDLVTKLVSNEAWRDALAASLRRDGLRPMWPVKVHRVHPTSDRHHVSKSAPYVVAVEPDSLPRKAGALATVERDVGRFGTTAVPVRLVRDKRRPPGSVAMDQTIRTAIGLRALLEDGPQETHDVRLRPLAVSLGDRLRNCLSRVAGRRYLMLRVARQDPEDIEKGICRIAEDDLIAMGARRGRRVILIAADGRKAGYSLARVRMQALDLSTERIKHRRDEEEATGDQKWGARHPATPSLLELEGADLSYVFLDLDGRHVLGVELGGVVLARRDTLSAAIGEVQEFGITFLVSLLSVTRFAKGPVGTAIGFAIAALISGVVLISRLRTELG